MNFFREVNDGTPPFVFPLKFWENDTPTGNCFGIIHLVSLRYFPKKYISYPLIPIRTCAHLGLRNANFSENFTNVLNEWPLRSFVRWHVFINVWKENNASYILLYVTHKTGAIIFPNIPLSAIIPGWTTCSLHRKKSFSPGYWCWPQNRE